MASLRDTKTRIKSVENTQQITRAMKMVSAAKLRRAQEAIVQARPYANKIKEILGKIKLYSREKMHPLISYNPGNREEIVLVSSDKGLCGGFNANVFRMVLKYIAENKNEKDISLTIIGKKGKEYFKRRDFNVSQTYVDLYDNLNYNSIDFLVKYITDLYLSKERSTIYFAYNEFKSAINQNPTLEKLLPIEPIELAHEEVLIDYTYEPNKDDIVTDLLHEGIHVQIYRMFLESVSSEHSARMTAMENATNNADDMISKLTLLYNRARQSAITTEIIEIVSGAEALK